MVSQTSEQKAYLFAYFLWDHEGVYGYEWADYGTDWEQLHRGIVDAAKNFENFVYDEEMTVDEFNDMEELRDSLAAEHPEAAEEDYSVLIWENLVERMDACQAKCRQKTATMQDIQSWVDDWNLYVERMSGQGLETKLVVSGARDFAKFVLSNILAVIEWDIKRSARQRDGESTFEKTAFYPFRSEILQFQSWVEKFENWPRNDVDLGRFLQIVDLYKIVLEARSN